MQVGSLVECIDNERPVWEGSKMPIKGAVYTVREIAPSSGGLFLEELVGYVDNCLGEIPFRRSRFRELLPPIANIEEQIKENTLELVEE